MEARSHMAAAKSPAKKSTAKKKPATKRTTAKSPAKKAAPATKASAKKTPAAKAPAKKAPAKKSTATKAPAKKAAAKKASTAKAPAKKAPAKKTTAKAPAKKAPAKKTTATKAVTKKAPAKKTAGKKSPAKLPTMLKEISGPPAKPKKPPYSKTFLKAQRELLLEQREDQLRRQNQLRAEADEWVADFQTGDVQFDEESGEGDTLSVERQKDLQLSENARHEVEEIDHALAKFELGTYGLCEASGEPIPEERLEALPATRVRVEYKAAGLTGRP